MRHAGRRIAQHVGDKETAELVRGDMLQEIRTGRFSIKAMKAARAPEVKREEGLTLRQYYEQTIRPQWEGSLSRNTFKSFDGSFRVHILPPLGDITLIDIARDRVKKFVADLRKKTVISNEQEPRLLSKETIRNIVAALRLAMNEAVESNLIITNPALRLGKYYREAADFREEIDPFTADEVSALLQFTRDHYGFENYVLMLTLFHCGLRAGEAAGFVLVGSR